MTGFKPQTSGIGSDRSTNWATTTAQFEEILHLQIYFIHYLGKGMSDKKKICFEEFHQLLMNEWMNEGVIVHLPKRDKIKLFDQYTTFGTILLSTT